MTVRWYRGAGVKKIRRVKRQKHLRKPTSPETSPKTKSRDIFRPRMPGVQPPGISMPFVSAGAVGYDSSMIGFDSLKYLSDKNGWDFVAATWKPSRENAGCTASEASNNCNDVARSWSGVNSWQSLAGKFPGAAGMWDLSHPNCSCHVQVSLKDETGREISFDVYPQDVNNSFSEMAKNITLVPGSTFDPPSSWDPNDYAAHTETENSFFGMQSDASGSGKAEPAVEVEKLLAPGQSSEEEEVEEEK